MKQEARRQIKEPTLLEQLARWWQQKYQLPSNHNLFQDQTEEELLIEFWVDIYEKNPLEAERADDGEIQLKNTGDPYIDKWEEEMAQGVVPDLTEMFTDEDMAKYARLRAQSGGAAPRHRELQEAVDSHNSSHPMERNQRDHQEALARKLSPGRFPGTFGDD